MDKKKPNLQVFGRVTEEEKQEIEEEIQGRFGERHLAELSEELRRELAEDEFEKELWEKRAIELINQATNRLLEELGFEPFDIAEQNIHFVTDAMYKKIDTEAKSQTAITFPRRQASFLNKEKLKNRLERLDDLIHEMVHLKSFALAEGEEKNNEHTLAIIQSGVGVDATIGEARRLGDYRLFGALNEAITAEIEKLIFKEILKDFPRLAKEFVRVQGKSKDQDIASLIQEHRLDAEDIIGIETEVSESGKLIGATFTHMAAFTARRILTYLVECITTDNQNIFKDEEDCQKEFFKAYFSGKMGKIARLTDAAFGKETFKELSKANSDDKNGLIIALRDLRQRRARVLRERE